jgi:predicted amino acid dehydrogenase
VLPTLSAPDTLRIEPSAFVDDRAIGHLAGGLRALCQALERGDSAGLLGHLVHEEELLGRGADPGPAVPDISMTVEPAATGARRVAFVLHYVFPERELAMSDPSLRSLSSVARRGLADRMMRLLRLKPTVAFARNLFDDQLWLAVILLPADVALLETLHRMDYRFLETERLQQAVDLGASLGCQCVALGGYTSILARDGTALLPPAGVKLTSGNTFTAVVGARRIVAACEVAGIDPARARLGVVGATGNIGSSLTRRLAEVHGFERVTLIGRDATKLEALARELADVADVQTSVDIAALRHCDAVAIATNTNDPLVYPEHLPPDRNVVIADVSVPSSVSRRVRSMARVHVVRLAGTVAVPGAPDLVLSSHTPPGTAFCCAAEAMLVGLEPEATSALALTGRVDPHSMDVLDRLGEEHGLFSALGEGGFKAG